MIGETDSDDVRNIVESGNNVNFALNRLGFNNSDYLAVRQHSMHFNTVENRNSPRHSIGAAITAADNNS
jgi:hypothetical protein